jgi:peptidoglycan/xylan/chitin deacetylase (PgdA/CDA1 family)
MGSVVHGICFHGIGVPRRPLEPGEERYWITADAFHTILDAIAEIPGIRISFDDGNASDLDLALQALLERKLVGSFFVIAGRLGSRGSLDADGLRELSRHGMTIGTHGMDHRPWRNLEPRDRERELVEARQRITGAVGTPIDEAAVPMGSYDRRLLSDLKRLGYSAVHTSDRRTGRDGDWLQPRFSIVAEDTVESVERYALAIPSPARRAWLAAKGRLKRMR